MTPEKNNSVKNEVNKAKSKVAKNLFQVGLATSMLFGAPACVPTEAISIIPTGETNPLPDGATKIPESPTDATYEVTPTIVDPATQELTLVSPTEVATEMPTITLTPEPTATATEMPTPTEIPEKYPIDLEKLHNFPQSYEYVVAHPEEFVEAPDPLEDIEVFNQWWNEKLIPVLGKREDREKNMIMLGGGVLGDNYDINNSEDQAMPLQGQPEMLFFKHEGVTYPIAIINVAYERDIYTNFTMAIILVYENILGDKGGLIALANGERIKTSRIYLKKNPDYPGIRDNLMDVGIKGEFSEENKLIFGSGVIVTIP